MTQNEIDRIRAVLKEHELQDVQADPYSRPFPACVSCESSDRDGYNHIHTPDCEWQWAYNKVGEALS